MTKLFVICGHGAGDPGACGNGYQEAERVRALGKRIKKLGGSNVLLGDINRNYYADNGINGLTISKDYQIVELHMDSATASARGAHVIIKYGLNPDKYDTALAKFVSGMFPGRSVTISKRSDLANPARAYAKGYGYRLIECGFISNAEDVKVFNGGIDKLAKGILECFGIGVQAVSKPTASKPTTKPKPTTSTKYKVGTVVCTNTLASSSTGGKVYKGDWKGTITKVIAGAKYPYLLNNGTGWTNDTGIDTDPHVPSTNTGAASTSKPAASKKQTVTLPKTAKGWNVYKTNVTPVIGNECGKLKPSKFGGLTYEILAKPQKDVVTIQTQDYGKVNIYVGKGTGAIIK